MEEMTEVPDLNPGDEVLWGDRKQPLTVSDENVSMSNGAPVVQVESNRGTVYFLIGMGRTTKVWREVTPGPNYPEGVDKMGYADKLRKVNDE